MQEYQLAMLWEPHAEAPREIVAQNNSCNRCICQCRGFFTLKEKLSSQRKFKSRLSEKAETCRKQVMMLNVCEKGQTVQQTTPCDCRGDEGENGQSSLTASLHPGR